MKKFTLNAEPTINDRALAGRPDAVKRDISLRAPGSRAADCYLRQPIWHTEAILSQCGARSLASADPSFSLRISEYSLRFRKFRSNRHQLTPGPEWGYYAASMPP
jgi:hypothetical protein